MNPQLIRITDVAGMKAAGLPFKSVDSARWCERTARDKGLAAAFVRLGKTVLIDPAKFHELARRQSSAA